MGHFVYPTKNTILCHKLFSGAVCFLAFISFFFRRSTCRKFPLNNWKNWRSKVFSDFFCVSWQTISPRYCQQTHEIQDLGNKPTKSKILATNPRNPRSGIYCQKTRCPKLFKSFVNKATYSSLGGDKIPCIKKWNTSLCKYQIGFSMEH